MTTFSRQEIEQEFERFIREHGGDFDEWFVGLTDHIRSGLFVDHNVNEDDGTYLARTARNHLSAQKVVKYFVDKKGTDGPSLAEIDLEGTVEPVSESRGGDSETNSRDETHVFAYRKSLETDP